MIPEINKTEANLIRGLLDDEFNKIELEKRYWVNQEPPMQHVADSLEPRQNDIKALSLQFEQYAKGLKDES